MLSGMLRRFKIRAERRNVSDRRSGRDRRKLYDVHYLSDEGFLKGLRLERRSEPERREEERKAWTLVEDLVNSYHRQALDQAKVQFWFSILAATAGFGWVLYSAIGIDPRELVTVSKTLPGGRR